MKRQVDWSFVLTVVAVGICFLGLALMVYGLIVGLALSMFGVGFKIVICGFVVGFVTIVLLLIEDYLKKLKHRTD